MIAQHTPGPWHVSADMHGIGNQIVSGVSDMVGNPIANCGTSADANARLIAAAPDLLAALQDLLPMWESGINEPWVKAARAAIAKATGGDHV